MGYIQLTWAVVSVYVAVVTKAMKIYIMYGVLMKVIARSNARKKLIAVRLNATLMEDTIRPTYNRKE